MSKEHIFKIQLPLVTNAPVELALVYNEDRSFMGEIPITNDLRALFPPDTFKIFATGTINNKGVVNLSGTVYQADELEW